jgi:hypothetical protein
MKIFDRKALKRDKGINFSKTHLWRLRRARRFPQPIKVGARVYWLEHEIDEWIAARAREREFTRRRVDRGGADETGADAEPTCESEASK